MTPKQFKKYLERDGGCVHCGDLETAVPHHRANRGMGGRKSLDIPSNIIVVCHWLNNAMESDARVASDARDYGWKISSHQDPSTTPVWYAMTREWGYLDNHL